MEKRVQYITYYWLISSLIIPNIALSVTESLSVWGALTNVVLPLGVLTLLACCSKNIGRTALLMLPLSILGAFQLVLLSIYGKGIISVDMFLNLVTTNSSEVCELLREMWAGILLVVCLYLPPIVCGIVSLCRSAFLSESFMQTAGKISCYIITAGLLSLIVCLSSDKGYSVKRDLYPVNIGYNMFLANERWRQTINYHQSSQGFRYNTVPTHREDIRETYVLVIGETSRAHDWELLGYGRHTNPRLSERENLTVFGNAYSESNTTHKSVPMLLSCVDARNFDSSLYNVKSLITAFKEGGFHTAFISNQLPNHSYIDFFGEEADTTLFVKMLPGKGPELTDNETTGIIKDFIQSDHDKQLIVIHSYGSHFDYRKRYSETDRVFTPDSYPRASMEYRAELLNAYDNSIVATDRFIDSIIESLNGSGRICGLVYTSDHGEDIYDNGKKRFTHASPTPTEYQLHVPLLVWLSPDYIKAFPETAVALRNNSGKKISTSRSFCPTSMGIAGLSSGRIDTSDDISTELFTEKELYYLDDHNIPISTNPRSSVSHSRLSDLQTNRVAATYGL